MISFDVQEYRPCRPTALDPGRDGEALVQIDGTQKQSLETGRARLAVSGLVFLFAFVVIGLRLFGLVLFQDIQEPKVAHTPAHGVLESLRADIVDRNGVVLATTLPTVSLYANPRQILDSAVAARDLAAVLPDLSEPELRRRLGSDRAFVWIKRKLTPRQQQLVNGLGLPGVYFQPEAQRVYPHGALTAHLVGLTDIDSQGLSGLEQVFDRQLRHNADPLRSSLDIRLQHVLAEELANTMRDFEAAGAAGLILDVDTGEILAMASLPSFDPADPGRAAEEARFNRASLGLYEMGSVFKIFTTAMALDQEVVALDDGFDVSQPIRAASYTITDFKPKNRWLSVPEIFIYSSNIGTVHMATASGTAAQQAFLDGLGLTRELSLELPERGTPLLPAPWTDLSTVTISYGHGLAVTPVHVAKAVAAVVNGGNLRPATLLKHEGARPAPARQVMSAQTSQRMRWLMRLAVQAGTGRKADAAGYLVGGKTGTADKPGRSGYDSGSRIASFAGAFPMDRPRFVVLAVVDEPKGRESTFGYATGGWVAAPAVGRIIERIGPMAGILPRSPDKQQGAERHLVPASYRGTALAIE